MSRIGKAPIEIPAGVTVKVDNNVVTVKGPKGELSQAVNPDLTIKVEDNHIVITRPSDDREHRAQHGLYRALIHNMVVGVSTGYRKEMELVGVGYRAAATGQVLELSLGFSHAIFIKLPPEVKVEAKSERNQNPLILLESDDKQ
ncbi:MAG: 50S ribosomal protein L6, partial [Muribaculaceae bacterium]|nr:50S ribosomal protein L6 [Muribaculaceae bacterium]